MMRLLKLCLCFFLLAIIVLLPVTAVEAVVGAAAVAAVETLTIRGDGVEKEIVFSRDYLEALKEVIERHTYSVSNNFPTQKTEYAAGVPLLYLLKQAGLKDSAQTITFTATDGYKRVFTVQELTQAPRYYFPETGAKAPVPAMICLQSSDKGFSSLEDIDLRLIMGQRAQGEQTNPWFVKYLSVIEVSSVKPDKWPEVTFNRISGPQGVTLQLLHENIDAVKIYYTTDNSAPTVESKMYNISASYYQPQLNEPLLINKTTVVKAIAIGAGKENSAVSSLTISFEDALFDDLANYEWARPAIEALAAKGIVNGVNDYSFDPAGGLTRAMFVTMLSRALNKNTGATVTAPMAGRGFSDVDYNSWYGPHIQWAVDKGIISGYPDGTFKPSNSLTVEEMIVMAVRAGGLKLGGPTKISGVSEWAKPYIAAAENNNMLIRGHLATENTDTVIVEGKRQANRAEAAVVLYQLLQ